MGKGVNCLKNSNFYYKNGWIYLHIEGDPYERGFQHGYHMAEKLSEIFKTLDYIVLMNTGKDFGFFKDAARKMYVPHMEEEYIEEMRGIAAGANKAGYDISFESILAWNAYIELLYSWWPVKNNSMTKKEHCSAFIATGDATKDNEIIMGHNTWWDFVIGQYFNVILDIKPSNGHRIFMQSVPGYIHSVADFFITGAGIIGTSTTIDGFNKYNEDGAPEFSRVRKAMQYGNSIDSFANIMLQNNNGGIANSWLLGNISTNEIARFEIGLDFSNLEKKINGYFTGYNSAEDPRIRNLECVNSQYNDLRGNGARRVRWEQLMKRYYGKVDLNSARLMIEDHYDVYLKRNFPSNRTICGHSDIDPYEFGGDYPFNPGGALDGTIISSGLAKDFSFWAKHGRSCSIPFLVDEFMRKQPEWSWQKDYIKDRTWQPWTLFKNN